MAYSKKYMIERCIEAIKDQKLIFIEEIFTFVSFCKATFYNNKLDELDSIKKAIEDNRIEIKTGLRKKWYENDNPTLQIALFKLVANQEELDVLNTQKLDHTSKGESIRPVEIKVSSQENADKLKKFLENVDFRSN